MRGTCAVLRAGVAEQLSVGTCAAFGISGSGIAAAGGLAGSVFERVARSADLLGT